MKSNNFTLQKYSGMSGVFLLLGNIADAQAVYTDIDPDIVIEFDGQSTGIDMDNNGTIDFVFFKSSWSYDYWNGSSTVWRFRRKIWAGPELITNEIAGETFTHGAGYGTSYHPYALIEGIMINEELSFQNWDLQTMAKGFYGFTFISSDTAWVFDGGFWVPDKTEEYLGVYFVDENECMHFGWIRCTTADSTNRLIIHDYAYETKCDVGIAAGDTIGDTTVPINEINTLDAVVYTFNKILYVKSEEYSSSKLVINNLQGQKILQQELIENLTIIDLAVFPLGNYVVTIINQEGVLVKEVNIR